MNLCNMEECTGCTACYSACPLGCISMQADDQGFPSPIVNTEKCVECGKCRAVCPIINDRHRVGESEAYWCAFTKTAEIRNSSSGGIAYALSKQFIKNGGVVFGAAYDEHMHVKHIMVSSECELCLLQGSKYVQSEIGDSFKDTLSLLIAGRKVLFFGTPCQIAGLLLYVPEKLHHGLYTCDLLCSGVPSPAAFEKYVAYLEKRLQCKIANVNFRSKKYGYSFGYLHEVSTADGRVFFLNRKDSSYVKSIGMGYVRPSCHECRFKKEIRIGDVSLGDYHAAGQENRDGLSSVLVNSDKGRKLLEPIRSDLFYHSTEVQSIQQAQSGAFFNKKKQPSDYFQFFEDLRSLEWEILNEKYFTVRSFREKIIEKAPLWLVAYAKKLLAIMKK